MATAEFFLSANRPEDDVTASGGAIDLKMRLLEVGQGDNLDGGAGDTLDLVSSAAGDVCNVDVAGYSPAGAWQEEVVALNGVNHVQSVNTYLHVRKIEMAADAIGTVTVAEFNVGVPITLFTIAIGERGRATLFLEHVANAGGGAEKKLYEKFFIRGTGGVLNGCQFYCSQDEETDVKFDCEEDVGGNTTTDGAEQVANRTVEPNVGGGYVWADHATIGTAHTMGDNEDGILIIGEAQGIWVEATLAAGRAADMQILNTLNWQAT